MPRLFIAIALCFLALAACKRGSDAVVTGTATYRERMALPPGATFEAELVDLSTKNPRGRVVASVTAGAPGVPIAFRLSYRNAAIISTRRYGVEARIRTGAKILFETESAAPVITRGNPAKIDIVLQKVTPRGSMAKIEAAVEAVAQRVAKLKRVEGLIHDGKSGGSFVAFVEEGATVAINEGRDLGPNESAAMSYFFEDGALVRYTEDRLRRASPPTASGAEEITAIRLYFAKGHYVGGSKTVDGKTDEPSEADVATAQMNAAAALDRVVTARRRSP